MRGPSPRCTRLTLGNCGGLGLRLDVTRLSTTRRGLDYLNLLQRTAGPIGFPPLLEAASKVDLGC